MSGERNPLSAAVKKKIKTLKMLSDGTIFSLSFAICSSQFLSSRPRTYNFKDLHKTQITSNRNKPCLVFTFDKLIQCLIPLKDKTSHHAVTFFLMTLYYLYFYKHEMQQQWYLDTWTVPYSNISLLKGHFQDNSVCVLDHCAKTCMRCNNYR